MRWTGHIACMGDTINAYKVFFRNLKTFGRDTILKWISMKWGGRV
jgi:hypothetical protein